MMKYKLLFLLFTTCVWLTQAQTERIFQSVSPENTERFKAIGVVSYSDFGAKGDGKTDDMVAIAATHSFANQHQLKVKADEEVSYYIGGKERTAIIQTDTNFGTASFIIDDREVEN
jgi:hypothetical protein